MLPVEAEDMLPWYVDCGGRSRIVKLMQGKGQRTIYISGYQDILLAIKKSVDSNMRSSRSHTHKHPLATTRLCEPTLSPSLPPLGTDINSIVTSCGGGFSHRIEGCQCACQDEQRKFHKRDRWLDECST